MLNLSRLWIPLACAAGLAVPCAARDGSPEAPAKAPALGERHVFPLEPPQPGALQERLPRPFPMLQSPEGLQRLMDLGAGDESGYQLSRSAVFSTDERNDIETKALFFLASYQIAADRYAEALQTCQEALRREPGNPAIMLAMAEANLSKARDALDGLEEAEAKMSEREKAAEPGREERADARAAARAEQQRAVNICEDILRDYRDHVAALLLKGKAEDSLGWNLKAIQSLERVRAIQPGNAEGLADLGLIYYKIAQWDKGIAAFEQLVAIRPNDLRGLLYLCFGYRVSGNPAKAAEYAQEALEYQPSLSQAHELKLAALQEARRWDDYMDALRDALALVPGQALGSFVSQYNGRVLRQVSIGQGAEASGLRELGVRVLRDQSLLEATSALVLSDPGEERLPFTLEQAARLSEALLPFYEELGRQHPESHRPFTFRARLSERAGLRREAIDLYREAMRAGAPAGATLERIARLWAALGQNAKAFGAYEEARAADPLWGEPLLGLGQLAEDLARYSEAAERYAKGLALEPGNARMAASLGRALRRSGEIDRSVEALNDALAALGPKASAPESAQLHRELARSFAARGDLALAARNMGRAVAAEPDSLDRRMELLEILLEQDDPDAAETLANLQRDFPALRRSLFDSRRLARLLMRFRRAGEALELVRWLSESDANAPPAAAAEALAEVAKLARGPERAESVREMSEKVAGGFRDLAARNQVRASLLAAMGDPRKAVAGFERAIRHGWMEPAAAYARCAAVWLDAGQSEEALGVVDKALEALAAEPRAARDLAVIRIQALAKAGRVQEAAQAAAGLDTEGLPALCNAIGGAFHSADARGEAERYYRQALDAAPDSATALNNLAYLLAEKGERLDEAETLARRALELNPGAGFILDTLGWVVHREGRSQEAVDLLRAAVELSGDDPVLYEHLGDALAALGQHRQALRYWRQAQGLAPDNAELAGKIAAASTR